MVNVAVTEAVVEPGTNPEQRLVEEERGEHFTIVEVLNLTMVIEEEPHL